MKKLLWLAAAGLLATAAQAQTTKFGLKVGGNLSNLSGDLVNQDQYNNRLGVNGGVMLNIGLVADIFSIQAEGLYSQKGFKYADQTVMAAGNTISNTGNVRYDYLDVPVLAKVKFAGLFVEAGPQYSYLLNITTNRTQSINGVPQSNIGSGTEDLSNVNRNELGYAAGLGFQSGFGPIIGLRYNGALTDFAKDGYSNNDYKNARNSVFQAYVGFLIGGD